MHEHMLVRGPAHQAGLLPMPKLKTPAAADATQADAAPDRRKLRGTNIELPTYVWDQVRTYLDAHPEQRVRHMVMAGFQALGLQIDPEDLIAERRRGPGG